MAKSAPLGELSTEYIAIIQDFKSSGAGRLWGDYYIAKTIDRAHDGIENWDFGLPKLVEWADDFFSRMPKDVQEALENLMADLWAVAFQGKDVPPLVEPEKQAGSPAETGTEKQPVPSGARSEEKVVSIKTLEFERALDRVLKSGEAERGIREVVEEFEAEVRRRAEKRRGGAA